MNDLDVLNEPLSAEDLDLVREGFQELVDHNRTVLSKARNSSGGDAIQEMPEEEEDGTVVINGVRYKKAE